MADETIHERVRRRLRETRVERGLTLQEAAGAAGMDASTLSRLESGARRVTLDHLPPLAAALGVRVDDLLALPSSPDPLVQTAPMRRHGWTYWPLTREATGSGLRAYKIRIPVDDREPEPKIHEGHEWLYVLSGRLRLWLGDHEHAIAPGEAAEFSTWLPHWMGAYDQPVELIAIYGPQGERVHFHGSPG